MGNYLKQKMGVLISVLGIFLIVPQVVTAATLGWSGASDVNVNSDLVLNITGADIKAAGGSVTVDDTSCLTFVSLTKVSANTANANKFGYADSDGNASSFVLAKATFRASGSACTTSVNIINPSYRSIAGVDSKPETIKKTINVVVPKSSNANLSSLTAPGYTLSPAFNSNTTSYTISDVDPSVGTITFQATPSDAKATVSSGLSCNLSGNSTACKVVVRAENGAQKTYTITVKKKIEETPKPPVETTDPEPDVPDTPPVPEDNRSSDATLKSLDLSGYPLSPSFDPNTGTYNVTVENGISGLDVNAIPNDSKANVSISGNNGWHEGVNQVRIVVTAENGTEKVYIVNVTKKAAANNNNTKAPSKSSDNTLRDMIISNGVLTPEFHKDTDTYQIVVPNDVNALDLKAIVNDPKATVEVKGNSDFVNGNNVVTIEVTAEDGSLKVYTVNVFRSELESKNKLKDLIVTNGMLSPTFDSNIFEYDITVDSKTNELNITAIPIDPNAKVEILGNENLKEGMNTVLVKVTDENGFVQYYRLNVNKSPKKKFLGLPFDLWMILLGVLSLVLLFLLILFLIFRKKDDKVDNQEVAPVPPKGSDSPVIEFKPEFNFGSKNGTDDDIVEAGGVLNQYTGTALPENKEQKVIEAKDAKYTEVPYDPYDDVVTKDEMYDALDEAMETQDPSKLQMLYEQEKLNRRKEKLKQRDEDEE